MILDPEFGSKNVPLCEQTKSNIKEGEKLIKWIEWDEFHLHLKEFLKFHHYANGNKQWNVQIF